MMPTTTTEPGGGTQADTAPETIGLVGVGLLGSAIAERLLAHGFRVLGFDLNASRLEALTALGGQAAGSSGCSA